MEMLTRQLGQGRVGNVFDQITRTRGKGQGGGMANDLCQVQSLHIYNSRLRLPPPEHDADIITAGLQSERGIFYCVRNILCK